MTREKALILALTIVDVCKTYGGEDRCRQCPFNVNGCFVTDGNNVPSDWRVSELIKSIEIQGRKRGRMTLTLRIFKRGQKLTNGDVIKTLFPNAQMNFFAGSHVTVTFCGGIISQDFLLDWWNAPYKAEGEDKEEENE